MQQKVKPGTFDTSKLVWQWQSEDGFLKAWAVLEKGGSLTVHFSSNDLNLEGSHLNICIGGVNREAIFRYDSDTEVYAKIEVSRYQFPRNLANITIQPA